MLWWSGTAGSTLGISSAPACDWSLMFSLENVSLSVLGVVSFIQRGASDWPISPLMHASGQQEYFPSMIRMLQFCFLLEGLYIYQFLINSWFIYFSWIKMKSNLILKSMDSKLTDGHLHELNQVLFWHEAMSCYLTEKKALKRKQKNK